MYIMYIMDKITLSDFGRNGNAVFDAAPVGVTRRGRPFLKVRRYTLDDTELSWLPWSIAASRSASEWNDFFASQRAQGVTLDSAPSLVVEQWSDDASK